ncbi:MAG: hypothetical protein ABH950_00820 [Candidatus Altiarchaeota archaeon]
MAKKKGRREDPTKKQNLSGSQKWGRIGVYFISAIMLLSAFSYFAGNTPVPPPSDDLGDYSVRQYQVDQVGNSTMLAKITEKTLKYLVIPDDRELSRMNAEVIESFIQANFTDVSEVKAEATNSFFIYTLVAERELNESLLKEEIGKRIRGYRLYRGFNGELQFPINSIQNAYVIGETELELGDTVSVILFSREDEFGGIGLIGFPRGKVEKGPVITAEVVNVSGHYLAGTYPDPSMTDELEKIENISLIEPVIFIPSLISAPLGSELQANYSASIVVTEENETEISSKEKLLEIQDYLDELGIDFELREGEVELFVPLETNLSEVLDQFVELGVTVTEESKIGSIKVAQLVLLENRLVSIRDYESFPASLRKETEIGDQIKVELQYLQLGEQILPYGATQIKEEILDEEIKDEITKEEIEEEEIEGEEIDKEEETIEEEIEKIKEENKEKE